MQTGRQRYVHAGRQRNFQAGLWIRIRIGSGSGLDPDSIGFVAGFRIRIHYIRIRIQYPQKFLDPDPDFQCYFLQYIFLYFLKPFFWYFNHL